MQTLTCLLESAAGGVRVRLSANGRDVDSFRAEVPGVASGTDLAAAGQELFQYLFDEHGLVLFDELRALGDQLRLELAVGRIAAAESLPWESLTDPRDGFALAVSRATPVTRVVPDARSAASLDVELPLNVLVVTAAPADMAPLDAEREWRTLRAALADLESAGAVRVARVPRGTIANLQSHLRRAEWHVVHIIAHGGYHEALQEGVLYMEDEDGFADPLTANGLVTLLRDAQRHVRLVMLNACGGGPPATHETGAVVASALVASGVPACIGMCREISDLAAAVLAREVYASLGDGLGVDEALAEGRKALLSQGFSGEWATPVLYTARMQEPLFRIAPTSAIRTGGAHGFAPRAFGTLVARDRSGRRIFHLNLTRAVTRMGRRDDQDVMLPHMTVSEAHAELRLRSSRWILRDCNSRNGTFVGPDRERVTETEVRIGQEIHIGPFTLELRATEGQPGTTDGTMDEMQQTRGG